MSLLNKPYIYIIDIPYENIIYQYSKHFRDFKNLKKKVGKIGLFSSYNIDQSEIPVMGGWCPYSFLAVVFSRLLLFPFQ